MKKIMFSDKYGLTQAVLEGRKTQTRRVINCPQKCHGKDVRGFHIYRNNTTKEITELCWYDEDERDIDGGQILPKYKVGEVVAIAQPYKSIFDEDCHRSANGETIRNLTIKNVCDLPGWTNKMFVRADLMPHHIRITDVRIQRLQDISEEDCIKEGVIHAYTNSDGIKIYHSPHGKRGYLSTDVAQHAFAFLIDKISGKGTWDRNPYVFVYDFELIK